MLTLSFKINLFKKFVAFIINGLIKSVDKETNIIVKNNTKVIQKQNELNEYKKAVFDENSVRASNIDTANKYTNVLSKLS